jgi:ATP adenylyltransferase
VEEEPQSLPPTPGQLAQAYAFLLAASRERRDLLAFYNGGPGAGASQRWRHLQFVEARAPVESWVRGMVFERPGECRAERGQPGDARCARRCQVCQAMPGVPGDARQERNKLT